MAEQQQGERITIDVGGGGGRQAPTVPAPFDGPQVNNLPIQVSFIVPSTRAGEDISKADFDQRVEFTRRWFSSTFGGDTTVRGSGGFVDENGNLVKEAVAEVESSTTRAEYIKAREDFAQFVRRRRRNWLQDAVAFKVEGRTYIYPEKPYIADDVTIPAELVEVG